MAVQNAGSVIREARLKAGLSQEKLSEGICSALSLSRIENGSAGVSPSTFQALMAHAGAPCEAYPIFANRTDFDCFYTLKRARFYLDCWQLKEAYNELETVEKLNFAKNKFYYQEWLFLYCKLQFRSGCANHSEIYDVLLEALHISRPEIDLSDFKNLLLSIVEMELFFYLAQEALYIGKLDICLNICTQVSSYVSNSSFSDFEKEQLLAEHAIVYSKYLIATKDYPAAFKLAHDFREKMACQFLDTCLHELTFLTGLSAYHEGKTEDALTFFKMAFFSAHSIESSYATTIQQYLQNTLGISLYDSSFEIAEILLISYPAKKAIDTSDFSDGTYDLFSPDTLTLGALIQELRIEQNLSQQILCQGLCSKSKLSKIENGVLQPEITLAQSLLQRLGISDAVFSFYGSKHETELHDLRVQMVALRISDTAAYQKCIDELLRLCTTEDSFYLQYASFEQVSRIIDKEESATALLQTLCTTLPDFTLNNISDYCFSWLELTILNNYCDAYCRYSPAKGTLALYRLMEYYDTCYLDILEKKRVFSIPLSDLSSSLYSQKRYAELVLLSSYLSSPAEKASLHHLGVFLANYSQALGEEKHLDKVPLYASYGYYNLLITNSNKTAEKLKYWILKDFNISLL